MDERAVRDDAEHEFEDQWIDEEGVVTEYGGNAGLSGWRDIGWPGDRQPLGYPATQVTRSDGPDPVRPDGAVAVLLRLLDPTWTGPGGG